MDGGRCGCAIRWVAGKWRTSGTQRLVSRRIPARYAALCIPGYGRVPSLCDERVQTEGWRLYNRSSAVVARASVSRGRRANPVLTYETALRRFFAYGDVLRRWRNQMMMADDVRGNRRRRGSGVPPARRGCCRGESRHATLRFAYRVTEECRRSATRECKPRDDVSTTALRR